MLVDNYVIKLWLYCTKLPIKIALYPLFDWILFSTWRGDKAVAAE